MHQISRNDRSSLKLIIFLWQRITPIISFVIYTNNSLCLMLYCDPVITYIVSVNLSLIFLSLFTILLSGKRDWRIWALITRLYNIFFPQAIRFLNIQRLGWQWHRHTHTSTVNLLHSYYNFTPFFNTATVISILTCTLQTLYWSVLFCVHTISVLNCLCLHTCT